MEVLVHVRSVHHQDDKGKGIRQEERERSERVADLEDTGTRPGNRILRPILTMTLSTTKASQQPRRSLNPLSYQIVGSMVR